MASLDSESIELHHEVGEDLLGGSLRRGWNISTSAVLDGDFICFERDLGDSPRWVTPPESGLAVEFAALSEAPDSHIGTFANDWGPLKVCEHGLWHWKSSNCESKKLHGDREPTSLWRQYSRAVKAMLRMGIGLRQGRLMSRKDWWDCFQPVERPGGVPFDPEHYEWNWELKSGAPEFKLLIHRRAFGELVDRWISCLEIRPQLWWNRWDFEVTPPELILSHGSILVAVMAHVLFELTGTHRLETCSNCGSFFRPKRAPRDGERHYCNKCGRRAAHRYNQRDYMRTKKGK